MWDPFDEQKTPQDKFYEIVFNANQNIVADELDKLIERLAALEVLLGDEEIENKINQILFEKSEEVENTKNDIYIHTMGSILTQNE